MARVWIVAILVLLVGCEYIFPKDGVGEVIGLKFGVPLDLKIKEGPRGPPVFHGYLREFYEVDFPNMEFEFVGVAVTRNDEATRKEGIFFVRENLIWGAFFSTKKPCEEKDFLRTKEYLVKNWKVQLVSEHRNKPGDGFFLASSFTSPYAIWDVSCGKNLGLSLVAADYSVLKNSGDESTREKIDKMLSEMKATFERKM